MSESGFREIQLSGKQVVFLFMAGVVGAVAIFLLGVSVGRGAAPDASAQATPPALDDLANAGPPRSVPPSTTPAPGELKYDETLRGKPDVQSVPATPTPTSTPPPTPTATPTPTSSPQPLKPAPSPTATTKPTQPPAAASASAVWYVQVNSFSSRANATRQVAELKEKGIAASVLTVPGSNAPYRVRVGPMDRAAADAMRTRLQKEGFKPSAPSR